MTLSSQSGGCEEAQGSAIRHAAELLRAGKLVAFPTETVYGLGADIENERAVLRIYQVKGRPLDHPLIVHFADSAMLHGYCAAVSVAADRLARRFWPGPLTLIVRRGDRVPRVVTGGLDTVALRVPDHPAALAMLREFGGAVAAPSANRFGQVSPTRAEHVRDDLGNDVDFILDGGPCRVGVESTIVDVSGLAPVILRPGGVSREELEGELGMVVPARGGGGPVRSPGQHMLHYAPRAEVILAAAAQIPAVAAELVAQRKRVVVLTDRSGMASLGSIPTLLLPECASEAARVLYDRLREVDRRGFDVAIVSLPPEVGLGSAIADRLRRAAGPRD